MEWPMDGLQKIALILSLALAPQAFAQKDLRELCIKENADRSQPRDCSLRDSVLKANKYWDDQMKAYRKEVQLENRETEARLKAAEAARQARQKWLQDNAQ